jgi:Family of unknown function (DUF6186)
VTSRVLTIAGYLMLAATLVATEVVARRPRARVPTFAGLVRWGLRHRSAQLGIVLAWWWLGWHFLLAL